MSAGIQIIFMSGRIKIRHAGPEDAGTVREIESASFDHGWEIAQIREELEHPDAVILLAFDGERAAGFASARKGLDFAELFRIAVLPEARRAHIGSALLDEVIAWTKQQGLPSLLLEVREDNAAAIGLYGEKGFRVTGKRKNYYDGNTAAVLMELSL